MRTKNERAVARNKALLSRGVLSDLFPSPESPLSLPSFSLLSLLDPTRSENT